MMLARYFIGLLAVISLVATASCGSTNNVGNDPAPDRNTSEFTINVLDESYVDGASAGEFDLSVEDYGKDIVVSVNVRDAENLKALYYEMAYNPEQYRPLGGSHTEAVGSSTEVISMQFMKDRGTVHYGQVLTNYGWRSGFSGDGTVATFTFRKQATPNVRFVSEAPSDFEFTTLTFDGTDTLDWRYVNPGDYDQNGQVNISDLTPLGANFQQSVTPDSFPFESNLSVVDGDGNGTLNISDLTPIGANFGNSALGGWNIYESLDAGDIPATNSDPNGAGATLTANVGHDTAIGDTGTDRLAFQFVIPAPVANSYYWVRATDGTEDGPRSNSVGGDPGQQPTLALTNPPGSGSGTQADPYIVDDATDYVFSLTDPTDGDVSTDPNTVYNVSAGAAGSIANTDATLNITDGFTGDFMVTATYNLIPNRADTNIHLRVEGIIIPTDLFIMPDPADADWAGVTGDGETEETAFVMHVPGGFNDDFSTEFTLAANTEADGSGDDIDVNTLEWSTQPTPFIVIFDDTEVSTFTANTFTSGTISAQDAELNESNEIHVFSQSLPE